MIQITDADGRDLIIGVAGGLIVLAISLCWRIVGAAGLGGLLHLRRSFVRAHLRYVESSMADRTVLLARLINVAIRYLGTLTISLLIMGGAVGTVLLLQVAPPHGFVRAVALVGFASILGDTLGALSLARVTLMAIEDYDGLVASLRAKSHLPADVTADFPAQDGPTL